MRFYCEITLLPNPEINLNFLWSKTFQQIHLGLVEIQNDQKKVPIGISFPEYKMGDKFGVLGGKLRLFALDEATLTRFNASKWLARLSDYVHCTGIRSVPEKIAGHATYQRYQPKINAERLARRYARRNGVDYDSALARYGEIHNKCIPLPFIRQKSLSSGQEFCLWIKKTIAIAPTGSTYSSYGLSANSTVPEF